MASGSSGARASELLKPGSGLPAMLATLFPVATFGLIFCYGVDVPRLDDWSLSTILQPGEDGLSWSRLARQHVESRPLTSRLVVLALAPFSGFNVRWLMYASFLAACLVSWSLLRLGRTTFPGESVRVLWLWAGANALVFGLSQSVTWLHGCHIGTYLVLATLGLGLVVSQSSGPTRARVGAAIGLATAASFSLGAGWLAWLLLPVVWAQTLRGRSLLLWGSVWCLAFVSVLGLYLWGFEDRTPGQATALRAPHRALAYALVFLGSPFGKALEGENLSLFVSAAIGSVLVALAFACGVALLRSNDAERWRRAAPWLCLSLFAMGCAVLAGIGRLAYGIDSALAPRYAAWSVYLPIGLLFLVPVAFEARRGLLRVGMLLALVLLFAHGATSWHALGKRPALRQEQLLMKSVVTFSLVAPEYAHLKKLFPWPERLQQRAGFLEKRGLLHPPLAASKRVREIALSTEPDPDAGGIESFQEQDGGLFVSGWARLPRRNDSAHAVLMCVERPGGEPEIIAVTGVARTNTSARPPAMASSHPEFAWSVHLALARLPRGQGIVTAWAYDALAGQAIRLPGKISLRAAP